MHKSLPDTLWPRSCSLAIHRPLANMISKVLVLATCWAVCRGGVLQAQTSSYASNLQHPVAAGAAVAVQPALQTNVLAAAVPVLQQRVEPYDPNPRYTYAYAVNDYTTGDSKSQHESRHGDVVQGRYSLTDPDGSRRIVDYTADPHNGFNAVVQRTVSHPGAAAVVAGPH